MMTATYSPDDNKLRLYASSRLDAETYAKVRAAGFIWAPKQELFVAPMWTPEREDLLIELCGEIEDEDKSLCERAEAAADRFEDYSEARAKDAEQAHGAVAAIADNIPLGQPILVGHHSERHARKDAERIENGMRRAVKMWDTSKYWTMRAKGAIHHAKYKERPDVRARRIKGLEADRRRFERSDKDAKLFLALWNQLDDDYKDGRPCDDDLRMTRAKYIANRDRSASRCYTLAEYPRNPPASQYEGLMGIWSALEHGILAPAQAQAFSTRDHTRQIEDAARWLSHINNRLEYEKAMLEDQGETGLLMKKPRRELLPLLNYRQEKFVLKNPYHRGETLTYPQIDMTAAEYSKIHNDYKGTRLVNDTHRIRTAMVKHALYSVFLTDSKVHEKPEPKPPTPPTPPTDPIEEITEGRTIWNSDGTDGPCLITTPPEPAAPPPPPGNLAQKIKAIKEQLSLGIQVVSAPQLFPTPPDLAARMVEEAEIEMMHRTLEPSAGTGNILTAIINDSQARAITAVEHAHQLAVNLRLRFSNAVTIHEADFLSCNGDLGAFDRILMNPPFENGSDIKHIRHAMHMLKPGGRLVAICANGPRQQEQLKPLASMWEELPDDTFKYQGTEVRTVLLTIEAQAERTTTP